MTADPSTPVPRPPAPPTAILHDTLHGTRPRCRGRLAARRRQVDPGGARRLELAAAGRPLMVDRADQRPGRRPGAAARREGPRPAGGPAAQQRLRSVRQGAGRPGRRCASPRRRPTWPGWTWSSSTAAKWAHVKGVEPWRHAIVDEAYQMRSDALLAVAGLFERALFVGDPGQLDPFSVVGAEQWAGLSLRPVGVRGDHPAGAQPGAAAAPAAGVLAAARLGGAAGLGRVLPVHAVPQRHRPRRPAAGASASRRDGSGPDRVIDEAAESGWGLLELPARHTPRTDPEAVRAVAAVVRRLLDRGGAADLASGRRTRCR